MPLMMKQLGLKEQKQIIREQPFPQCQQQCKPQCTYLLRKKNKLIKWGKDQQEVKIAIYHKLILLNYK